jgi:hypothetical protein
MNNLTHPTKLRKIKYLKKKKNKKTMVQKTFKNPNSKNRRVTNKHKTFNTMLIRVRARRYQGYYFIILITVILKIDR